MSLLSHSDPYNMHVLFLASNLLSTTGGKPPFFPPYDFLHSSPPPPFFLRQLKIQLACGYKPTAKSLRAHYSNYFKQYFSFSTLFIHIERHQGSI